jgi:large subunit ribosomal protein L17
MRHRIQDKKFNRDSNHRKALFMGLLRNLTEQGSIVTTKARAKAVKRLADRMVHTAQGNDLASRRKLHMFFGKRDVANKLVDVVAPAMSDRNSGFVRITDLGSRRGDNTPMVRLEFTTQAGERGLLKKAVAKVKTAKAEKSVTPEITDAEVVTEEKEAKPKAAAKPKKAVAAKAKVEKK